MKHSPHFHTALILLLVDERGRWCVQCSSLLQARAFPHDICVYEALGPVLQLQRLMVWALRRRRLTKISRVEAVRHAHAQNHTSIAHVHIPGASYVVRLAFGPWTVRGHPDTDDALIIVRLTHYRQSWTFGLAK